LTFKSKDIFYKAEKQYNAGVFMKKDAKFYWKLFISTFMLSAFTIGGGYVIVPLMRRKFVNEFHWIDECEMLDITAVAQTSPGAIAVNAAILIGYRLAGLTGSLITIIGTALPPLITISVISLFYTAFRDSAIASAALMGARAGVAAVMVDAVISTGKAVLKKDTIFTLTVLLLSFTLSYILDIHIALIIIACGFAGWASTKFAVHKGGKEVK
jgi:chromate transporter